MVAITVELHAKSNLTQLTIDSNVQIPFLAQLLKKVFVVTLAILYQRCKHVNLLALVTVKNQTQNLVEGILNHFLTRKVAESIACTGKEKTQIVVDLGHGSHR